jgi:membrane protease YdiL (CAAX protease family)
MKRLDTALRLLGRIFVLGLFTLLAFVVAGVLLNPILPTGAPAGGEGVLAYGLLSVFALLVGHIGVTLLFERGDWTATGFQRESWRPLPLLIALVAGVGAIMVPAGLLLATGQLSVIAMPDGPWASAALDALVLLAGPALAEELMARGYVFGAIQRQYGAGAALVLTSAAFGLLHLWNPGATAWSVGAVMIAGLFLGGVRAGTGSLAAAFLAHLGVNWAQGALLHAPISGLEFLATPDYRVGSSGPAWLTGGAWGLEAGAATAVVLLVVTFPYLYGARGRARSKGAHRSPGMRGD